jgi:hypothetical protein
LLELTHRVSPILHDALTVICRQRLQPTSLGQSAMQLQLTVGLSFQEMDPSRKKNMFQEMKKLGVNEFPKVPNL